MKRIFLLGIASVFLIGGCATAPDLRGFSLPGRGQADAITKQGVSEQTFKGVNRQVYASANIEYILGEISSFWVTINNQSETKPVNIDYRFSEFFLLTTDGQKRSLIIPEAYLFPSQREIPPRGSVTLQVRLGRPKVVREDIKMIECSFELGKTRVFLFPNPPHTPPNLKHSDSFFSGLFY